MIKKIKNSKLKISNYESGFTYVELIVVLSIFAILSGVVLFNYPSFQDNVDIQNLASDVALNIVQAQNAALSGVNPNIFTGTNKPSYGVYFNTNGNSQGADTKDFIYFADLNNNGVFESGNNELVSKYTITKNDTISNISYFLLSESSSTAHKVDSLSATFIRPNSEADLALNGVVLTSSTSPTISNISYVQITIQSNDMKSTSYIKLYPPGRVQVD